MAERRQFIRQTPADAEEFIGREGEIVIELETFLIRVHDGVTPGGYATLTLASALAQFVTLTDFNAAVAQIITDVTVLNEDAIAEIFGNILIAKGPVIDIVTGPPGSPSVGDRYLIAAAGTSGVFIGKENQVAEWLSTSEWIFSGTPLEGHQVYVEDVDTVYYYTTVWGTANPDTTYSTRQTEIDDELALRAPLASPTFNGVPAAPTAALGTNTTQVATTAFVRDAIDDLSSELDTEFDFSTSTNGYQKMRSGIIFQWCQGVADAADDSQNAQTVNFPIAFPNQCLHAQVTSRIASGSAAVDNWYQLEGTPGLSSCVVRRQHGEGGVYNGSTTTPFVFAVGY